MPLPTLIAQALDENTPQWTAPDTIPAQEHECQGAKHHSPRPLLVHLVELADGRSAWLCGTCKDNVATLVHLLDTRESVPWPLKREFGNLTRKMAEEVFGV